MQRNNTVDYIRRHSRRHRWPREPTPHCAKYTLIEPQSLADRRDMLLAEGQHHVVAYSSKRAIGSNVGVAGNDATGTVSTGMKVAMVSMVVIMMATMVSKN